MAMMYKDRLSGKVSAHEPVGFDVRRMAQLQTPNEVLCTVIDGSVKEQQKDPVLFSPVALSRWLNSRQKRIFDLAVAGPALFCSAPLLVVIAVAIKCTSQGPAMFRQERVGRGHQPFTIYKFRTMTVDEYGSGSTVTASDDVRLTAIGKVLRRLKLDELPQLYNVVRGEMSLVGPRPKLMAHERMQLVCRPGITGIATLAFAREEDILTNVREDQVEHYMIHVLNPIKAQLDINYVENGTFLMDVRILASTVFRLGRRKLLNELPIVSGVESKSKKLSQKADGMRGVDAVSSRSTPVLSQSSSWVPGYVEGVVGVPDGTGR
jgi:lipopolysaccharide/colanic/teichoic acid biosynthesis glycosyltransferase